MRRSAKRRRQGRSFYWIFVILVTNILPANAMASGSGWPGLARRLTGETEIVREKAIQELRKIKGLNNSLVQALETDDRALALDVIAALPLPKLMPVLLARSEKDPDGFLVLTVNALLTRENSPVVTRTYKRLLLPDHSHRLSPGAITAMIDPLGRLGIRLSKPSVRKLLVHPYPEIHSAALTYIRQMIQQHKRTAYVDLLPIALESEAWQIRLQTLSLVEELKAKRDIRKLITASCTRESHSVVKARCQLLLPAEPEPVPAASPKGGSGEKGA